MKDPKDNFLEEEFPDKEFPETDPEMKDLEPIQVGNFKEDEILLEQEEKKKSSKE